MKQVMQTLKTIPKLALINSYWTSVFHDISLPRLTINAVYYVLFSCIDDLDEWKMPFK